MNDFVAGLVGGLGGLVIGHPLDTMKALMQTNNQTNIISSTKTIGHRSSYEKKIVTVQNLGVKAPENDF